MTLGPILAEGHRPAFITADTTPKFMLTEAVRLAKEVCGLTVTATALPSERDQNFALNADNGRRFVLKIAKSDEARSVLELQNAALKCAAQGAPHIALPRLIPTSAGADMATITGAAGRLYFVRLFSWVEGEMWVHALPHEQGHFTTLGSVLADLDRALQDFSHPAMHRELHWDVKRAGSALQHLPLLPVEQQTLVQRFMTAWHSVHWTRLRHSVIHGDVNDYNVIVHEARVVGLLDFGDLVHSAMVCDLAIALAYALLDKSDPLAAAVPVIRAYHAGYPLTPSEIEALYPLMTARLCMSLCYAAYNAQIKRGDAYQLVTAGPAWTLLRQLAGLPNDAAQNAFRRACEMS
jgi:Ser/Thr protein kinase RdoA (MazF antagonist)